MSSPVVTIKKGEKGENHTKNKIGVGSVVKENVGDIEEKKGSEK